MSITDELMKSGYKYSEDHVNDIISIIGNLVTEFNDSISLDPLDLDLSEDSVQEQYNESINNLKRIEKVTPYKLPFYQICEMFDLDELETFCFMLSLLTAGEKTTYYKIFSEINNDNRKFLPTYENAIRIYDFSKSEKTHDLYRRKVNLEKNMKSLICESAAGDSIVLSNTIYTYLLTNGEAISDTKGVSIYNPNELSQPLPIMEDVAQDIYQVVQKTSELVPVYFYINGSIGSGKFTQVKRFADINNSTVVIIDLNLIEKKDEKSFNTLFENTSRLAFILGGDLCVKNIDKLQNGNEENSRLLEKIIELSGTYVDYIFLLSQNKDYDINLKSERLWVDVPIRLPNSSESVIMWESVLNKLPLKDELIASDLANKFTYTPGQILETFYESERMILKSGQNSITSKEIYRSAHKQTSHKLSNKADLVYAKNTWDELVLPDKEKTMLKNACNQVRFKHIVYDKWGMKDRISYGKGISMLFAGPPGTGKTMGANVIANELDIEMYKVNFSQIVSKYIGETEKNLNELFEEAKKTNVILFFDETDAILGKRTEVKDSHDKNANLETSYLLQKMEEYNGITIMTTNYLENIDSAFFRRISYVVHFPFPDIESRKKIWQGMFPTKMPIDPDMDFDYLAKQFEISGGNIKNTVVSAAFLAAQEDTAVDMSHVLKALKYELSKQGKIMLKEEFGEYEYLIQV